MNEQGGASTLGLLTYSRNDVDGVLRNVRLLRPLVDEVVVVDSSLPPQRTALSRELRPPEERICPVPPLGVGDLLRPFGVARMSTDRVLQLDSDEVLSPELLSSLPRLLESEAYVVPRLEVGTRGFTYHMRLFRRTCVEYLGPSCGFPRVRGRTDVLPRRLHILHHAPRGRHYWSEGDRRRRYLLSDLLERPYDRRYLRRTLGLEARGPRAESQDNTEAGGYRPLSDVAVAFSLLVEAGRALLTTASPGIARMGIEQGRERIAFWNRLTSEEKSWVADTSQGVREAGGLVQFLGLDEAAYVERLNEAFDATVDGPSLLGFLLHVRSQTGHPWDGGEIPSDIATYAPGSGAVERRRSLRPAGGPAPPGRG